MSTLITPELRSQVIASIKEGTTIAQVAEAHGLKAKTVSKWMRQGTNNAHSSASELQKAKKEIVFLHSVILDLVLEQKATNRKG